MEHSLVNSFALVVRHVFLNPSARPWRSIRLRGRTVRLVVRSLLGSAEGTHTLIRSKCAQSFRVTFERLENRELMTADLGAYSSAAFLSSARIGADGSADQQLVGGVFMRLAVATTQKQTTPAAPSAPAAPVAPAPTPEATAPAAPKPPDWFDLALRDPGAARPVPRLWRRRQPQS